MIDRFLPVFDVGESHEILVEAPPHRGYAAARRVDMGNSRIIRSLFRLRGLPARLTIDDMVRQGFLILGERPGREFVLGAVGRFWTPTGQLRSVEPAAFMGFSEPNTAKVAWNFVVSDLGGGRCLVQTETRVATTDDAARKSFRRYWRVIGPFSGLVRIAMLRLIKTDAERPTG